MQLSLRVLLDCMQLVSHSGVPHRLLKRMQLTCTAWARSLNPGDPVKNISLHHCMTIFQLVAICVDVSLITNLK
jgi:hypothetical protein